LVFTLANQFIDYSKRTSITDPNSFGSEGETQRKC
jgi:hypothetical protein